RLEAGPPFAAWPLAEEAHLPGPRRVAFHGRQRFPEPADRRSHSAVADVVPALRPDGAVGRQERVPLPRPNQQSLVLAGQDLHLPVVLARDINQLAPLALQAQPLDVDAVRLLAELVLQKLFRHRPTVHGFATR